MTTTNGNVNEGKKNTYILFTRLFENIRCVVKTKNILKLKMSTMTKIADAKECFIPVTYAFF